MCDDEGIVPELHTWWCYCSSSTSDMSHLSSNLKKNEEHDDITEWKHNKHFPLVLCAGNSPVTGEFPAQRPVTWRFDVSFICAWIKGWVNNHGAGDLRCDHAHYWPALRAGLLCCNFFGQPGSVSKFPPLLWVKLWVGWVGRGYTEISRYFPASWINWVTLVTKIKLLYSLRF